MCAKYLSSSVRAVIPAGGVGSRAGVEVNGQPIPKQYRCIKNIPMLLHTVHALLAHSSIVSVHIGVASNDDWIDTLALPERCYVHRTGGETRANTVVNTMAELPDEGWVLVHDAARPGLPLNILDTLIKTCIHSGVGGILALPVNDTVKRENEVLSKQVVSQQSYTTIDTTVERRGLWLAQTPQLFPKVMLQNAIQIALSQGFAITDEASAIEFIGEQSLLVKGHWRNLKVTWQEDFELVEYFL